MEGFLLVLVWTIILLALVKTRSFLLAPFPSRYWPIYALCRLVLPTLGMEGNRNKIPNISVAKMALFRRSFSHTMNLPSVGLHPTSLCWRTGKKIIKSTKSYFQLEHSMTIFAYWLWLLYSFPSTFILFSLSSHFFSFLSSSHCLKWLLPHWLQVFCKILHGLSSKRQSTLLSTLKLSCSTLTLADVFWIRNFCWLNACLIVLKNTHRHKTNKKNTTTYKLKTNKQKKPFTYFAMN